MPRPKMKFSIPITKRGEKISNKYPAQETNIFSSGTGKVSVAIEVAPMIKAPRRGKKLQRKV